MPELSRFGGMVIYMLFMDTKQHNKPHVHVYYGDYEATVGIDGELLAGALPKKQLKMVVGWLAFHIKHGIWQYVVNILIRLLPCKEVL